jgi:hypothetical protein
VNLPFESFWWYPNFEPYENLRESWIIDLSYQSSHFLHGMSGSYRMMEICTEQLRDAYAETCRTSQRDNIGLAIMTFNSMVFHRGAQSLPSTALYEGARAMHLC